MSDVIQTATPDLQEEKMVSDQAGVAKTTGEQLTASRLAKNWTVQFVAEQLKLSQVQILALEADNFDALPKMVIVRGFVRAYAKLLKVDGDGLVAGLPRDTETVQLETSLRPALSTPFVDSRLSLQGQHDNNRRYLIGAATLLLIVGLFLLLQVTELGKGFGKILGPKDGASSEVSATASTVVEVPVDNVSSAVSTVPKADSTNTATDPVLGAAPALGEKEPTVTAATALASEKSISVPSNSELKAPIATAANTVVPNSTNTGVSVAPNQAAGTAATAATKVAQISLPPAGELFVLKFKQDSWIQVKTESGTILSSHLAKAGSEESFSVKQALNVKIGNAAGVEAVLRGEPLPIASDRGNNVANLVVK